MPTPPLERRGRIITFYSYKGGVGRSMALANVATLLAGAKQRVLVIDWDLEAPGLERYFESDEHGVRGVAVAQARNRKPGVVDLVKAFEAGHPIPWQDCLIPLQPLEGQPPLFLISAGRDDVDYAANVRSLDWAELFEEKDFGDYLEELRNQWLSAFDFIFIDSRTGLTDSGGVCTIHLPDIVVALFTASGQSVAGIRRVLREARSAHQELPVDRARLQLVPVPARDETQSEYENARMWRETFANELGEFYASWLPHGVSARQVLERLKIPYKPYWSFGERLPVVQEGTSDPAGLGYAYAVLAGLLETNLDWLAAPEAAAMTALPTQRSAARTWARLGERALPMLPRALTWVLASLGFWFLVQTWWQQSRPKSEDLPVAVARSGEAPLELRLREADRLLLGGDVESARAIYDGLIAALEASSSTSAVRAAPLDGDRVRLLPSAYLGRGRARMGNDGEGAARDFSRAAELAVDDHQRAEALFVPADVVASTKQSAAALADLARVAQLVPNEPIGLLAQAEVAASRGRFEEAASHYRAVLQSDQGDAGPTHLRQLVARAHYGLGEALQNAGRLGEAADEYTHAILDCEAREDRSPRCWRARYARGVALRLLGRPEAALSDFQAVAQQEGSAELRDSALAVIVELGITRVKVSYARATDRAGALELATKINDLGKLNVGEVTLSSVPAVAEVRYADPKQKEVATLVATRLNVLLRKQYGAALELNVRAVDPYAPSSSTSATNAERTAIEVVLPALMPAPASAPVVLPSAKRSYLDIVQQDLASSNQARDWAAVADTSDAYSWVVVASRPTIAQAFDAYQRWMASATTRGAPGVELELQLKYAINYWYAVAFRANDAAHQRAILEWAKGLEGGSYAKQASFPVEIRPRSPDAARKAATLSPMPVAN